MTLPFGSFDPESLHGRYINTELVIAWVRIKCEKHPEITATDDQIREVLRYWTRKGRVRNYGGTQRGRARYDAGEICLALRVAFCEDLGILHQ